MKNLFTLLIGLLLCYSGSSQTTSVAYTPSSSAIANPERGFYRHTETYAGDYEPLNQASLTAYRVNNNYTLILRVFYLEKFVKAKISNSYLNAMKADFSKIRGAGMKCIVRFAYSDDAQDIQRDATKAKILSHIEQLKPVLQANADVIAAYQAGFIGSWGEWYYTDHFGMNPTATDYANRKAVLEALLSAVPGKMVQVRTPAFKRTMYNSPNALSPTQAFTANNLSRIGHHNDCFLASDDDEGTYINPSVEYPYLEQETKFVPMGGESCAVNAPRSKCSSALTELKRFHWTYMNLDYYPEVINGFRNESCFNDIQNKLGYRFEMTSGIFSNTASAGGSMSVTLKINNTGYAAPFNARKAYIVLRNTATGTECSLPMATDPRLWNAQSTTTIAENLALPGTILPGSYKLFLKLPDNDPVLASRPEYSIRMANEGTWDAVKGANDLKHVIVIGPQLAKITHENQSPKIDVVLYPVPANGNLTIEGNGAAGFDIAVRNSIGQDVHIDVTRSGDNNISLDTQSLADGIYFVSIGNKNLLETRRIIISH